MIISINNTKERQMKYEYTLWGSRYGGEHTIGTIPKTVADYWLDKGQDAFEEYMFAGYWDDDKEELNKTIPEEFQINEYWHDIDDIEHMCSVEFESSNVLIIEDAKTGETVAEIPMTDDKLGAIDYPESDAYDNDEDIFNGDKVIVYGQSFEKGGFDFENLLLDEPFDVSKVKFNVTQWVNLKLVGSVSYGDTIELNIEGGDTFGKSMEMWIDD